MEDDLKELGLKYGLERYFYYPLTAPSTYLNVFEHYAENCSSFLKAYEEYRKVINLLKHDNRNKGLWNQRLMLERKLKDMVGEMQNSKVDG